MIFFIFESIGCDSTSVLWIHMEKNFHMRLKIDLWDLKNVEDTVMGGQLKNL